MKTKQKIIGSVVILVMLIIFLVIGLNLNKSKNLKLNEDDIFVESTFNENNQKNEEKIITVYIKGEVKKPGVYRLKYGSIVEDLVKEAGGFTDEINPDSKLNLAKKLKDEDYIYVDKKTDNANNIKSTGILNGVASENNKIDINTATIEELDKIPGVGAVTAQKIVDYREKNGYFNSIEDLDKIDGIGKKTIDKFKDIIDIR
ncbi:competence protein ComEA [Clostridium sp. USBA 49]|jgi:competence protein ComEA|uniref:helix-hairpin-helix domain-containing protein n=1 Tax=Clostridium TaxID=1485 RepID=UPI00099933B4|nr:MULTISPECIES: helix-hairpin-helix domain-containing protein [Clostridium]SKA75456.1 competence protein ComEA [Clostridium sp. USBA 49]